MASLAKSSHVASALSIVDILTVLYFHYLRIRSTDPLWIKRDRFILSKGHASSALYATLALAGFFPKSYLEQYYCDNGILPGHVDFTSVPGLEASAGSLGHGLSIGIGMALASKMDKQDNRVVVLMGDGELNEGSVWEGILFAPHHRLDNLTVIIDYNKWQACGRTNEILNLEPLLNKFISFNWDVETIDGHCFQEITQALEKPRSKPRVIIANTTKGKGVSFMEDDLVWHYRSPNEEELNQAMKELL